MLSVVQVTELQSLSCEHGIDRLKIGSDSTKRNDAFIDTGSDIGRIALSAFSTFSFVSR